LSTVEEKGDSRNRLIPLLVSVIARPWARWRDWHVFGDAVPFLKA